jgi:hypothetical protein
MSMFGPPKPVYEIMFAKYAGGDGKIDAKDFQRLCFGLGYALTDEEQVLALKTLDADASGTLELNGQIKDAPSLIACCCHCIEPAPLDSGLMCSMVLSLSRLHVLAFVCPQSSRIGGSAPIVGNRSN